MEAVPHRPSQPIAPPSAPPKLVIEKFADRGVACIKFTGTIDESFDGRKLGAAAGAETLVLDLGGVKKISSFGIREWVDFVAAAGRHARSMILVECSPKVVDQLNMVANFAGGGRVFSFYAPFRCDFCDAEQRVLLQADRDHEAIKAMKLAERPCTGCDQSMYFDEDGATFFSYMVGQERFALEPEVEAFLAAKLHYAVGELNRKMRADKVIDGRTTYLKLTGDLDDSFPRDKLAEGLEGTVLVDLGAVGKLEPVGAMAWRGFVQLALPVIDQLYLAAVPPAFVERLCTRDDLHAKVQVVTLLLPYTCPSCGTTSAHAVDVAAHYEVLKFATAPELRCPQCKHAMQCQAGESLMAMLPTLPKPTASGELLKSIGLLRERALSASRKPAPAIAATAAAPAARGGARSLAVPVLAALIAVVVAAGGYLAYQRLSGGAAAREGELVGRSAPARPAWIAADAPGAATCVDGPSGLSCVGVSTRSARLDDAEEEAADAAYDALAGAIAARITDPAWKQAVPSIYQASREAKLGALDRAPDLTTARRDVREARRAVAQALRATGGAAIPATPTGRYWEEYGGAEGKRYTAFAQLALGSTELARLVADYARPASALGATVVGAFPLVGWRYPRVERGAIVTALASGPLQSLGLAEQYVVLSVGGRDVADAEAFARVAAEEHAGLAERGGTLRLKVQTPDLAPREFSAAIAARPAERPETGGGGPRPSGGHGVGVGNINVWDKYDVARPARDGRTRRDDPDQ